MKTTLFSLALILISTSYSTAQVNYSSQIQPIFNSQCVGCHGPGQGIDVRNYTSVMNSVSNQYSSNIVIAEDPEGSPLYDKVRLDKQPQFGSRMPQGSQLSQEQVDLIKNWIEEGALENANTSNEEVAQVQKFELLGNYPNPFNPSTQIRFNTPSSLNFIITVYNMVGQKVLSQKGVSAVGLNSVMISMSSNSSGLYLYDVAIGASSFAQQRLSATFTLLK